MDKAKKIKIDISGSIFDNRKIAFYAEGRAFRIFFPKDSSSINIDFFTVHEYNREAKEVYWWDPNNEKRIFCSEE